MSVHLALLLLSVGASATDDNLPTFWNSTEMFHIPSVVYVPPSVLQLYRLMEAYKPEHGDNKVMKQALKELFNGVNGTDARGKPYTNYTLGEFFKNKWSNLTDSSVRHYLQWLLAHSLNLIFATSSSFPEAYTVSRQLLEISLENPTCPNRVQVPEKLKRFCETESAELTQEDIAIAEDTLHTISQKVNFWKKQIHRLTTDKVQVGELKDYTYSQIGGFLRGIIMSRGIIMTPGFARIAMGYQWLLAKEMVFYEGIHEWTLIYDLQDGRRQLFEIFEKL